MKEGRKEGRKMEEGRKEEKEGSKEGRGRKEVRQGRMPRKGVKEGRQGKHRTFSELLGWVRWGVKRFISSTSPRCISTSTTGHCGSISWGSIVVPRSDLMCLRIALRRWTFGMTYRGHGYNIYIVQNHTHTHVCT